MMSFHKLNSLSVDLLSHFWVGGLFLECFLGIKQLYLEVFYVGSFTNETRAWNLFHLGNLYLQSHLEIHLAHLDLCSLLHVFFL